MTELSPETVKEFVISAHFNFEKVKEMLVAHPALLNAKHPWSETDHEDALAAAAHVGNRDIAEYVLEQGAPLTITAAAMLGRRDDVEAFLDETPDLAYTSGAHNIPLLVHAAISGDLRMVKMLFQRGATTGISMALLQAATFGHDDVVAWLADQGADVNVHNAKGVSALALAKAQGHQSCVEVLKAHGAIEEVR